jgi:hypothetical protein
MAGKALSPAMFTARTLAAVRRYGRRNRDAEDELESWLVDRGFATADPDGERPIHGVVCRGPDHWDSHDAAMLKRNPPPQEPHR